MSTMPTLEELMRLRGKVFEAVAVDMLASKLSPFRFTVTAGSESDDKAGVDLHVIHRALGFYLRVDVTKALGMKAAQWASRIGNGTRGGCRTEAVWLPSTLLKLCSSDRPHLEAARRFGHHVLNVVHQEVERRGILTLRQWDEQVVQGEFRGDDTALEIYLWKACTSNAPAGTEEFYEPRSLQSLAS